MKNALFLVALLPLVAACSTPVTTLKNKKGETVTCGGSASGSMMGGAIGYNMQKSNDDDCVKDYTAKGYKPVDAAPAAK